MGAMGKEDNDMDSEEKIKSSNYIGAILQLFFSIAVSIFYSLKIWTHYESFTVYGDLGEPQMDVNLYEISIWGKLFIYSPKVGIALIIFVVMSGIMALFSIFLKKNHMIAVMRNVMFICVILTCIVSIGVILLN